jgi:phosphoribosyl-AMP cyclohydrolase
VVREEFLDRCVERIRHAVPDAVAVFFGGSQLRGDAGPYSDVDFEVLVAEGPRDEWPAWFDRDEGRLLRVSLWVRDAEQWFAEEGNAQAWAFWLPCVDPLRLCWAADESWRQRLDRPGLAHPPGPPELDHLVGDLGKAANAYRRGDELALRLAASDLAQSCPAFLQPLNPRPAAASRYGALLTALDADIAPAGYRADLLTCLGLIAGPTTAADVFAAATRLGAGVISLVHAHLDTYADLLPPDQVASLRDGSLPDYVRYLAGARPPS